MPDYKLMYFNARGQAEISRLLFAAAGVKYADERYNQETWPTVKDKTPCGQLPCLIVDDQIFSQSIPIAVYLSQMFDLHGSNSLEALRVNEVIAASAELQRSFGKAVFEKDETKKEELKKKLNEEQIPTYIKNMEKLLAKSDSGCFAKKMTIADIIVFDTLDMHVRRNPCFLDGFSKIKTNMDKVKSNPGICDWLKNRPETEL